MDVDSLDKIVTTYFAALTRKKFTYKGVTYQPRSLRVSPGITRGALCPPFCGGCCMRFSLDYLPAEAEISPRVKLSPRTVEFNGKEFELYSDLQNDHKDHFCRYLRLKDGRCKVHGQHPFTCDFELIRIKMSTTGTRADLNTQKYGRGWAFLRSDGERGALTSIVPPTKATWQDTIRKLSRLQQWASYFNLETKLPQVLEYVIDQGPFLNPKVF